MSLYSDFRNLKWDIEKLVLFDHGLKEVISAIQFRFIDESNREGMRDYLQICLDHERDPFHQAVYFSLIQLHNQAVTKADKEKEN